MSVGAGLFLGLLVCAIVYLFVKKPEIFNGKRLFKGLFVGVLGVAALIAALWAGGVIYDTFMERPKPIESVGSVNLGDSLSDVKFKVGSLVLDLDRTQKSADQFNRVGDGIYKIPDSKLEIEVFDGKVALIDYSCDVLNQDNFSLNGVGCGASGEDIIDRFGKQVKVFCLKEDVQEEKRDFLRLYEVPNLNTRYFMYKNQVLAIYVASQKRLANKSNWKECLAPNSR